MCLVPGSPRKDGTEATPVPVSSDCSLCYAGVSSIAGCWACRMTDMTDYTESPPMSSI